jgi:hypothetical protein
MIEMSANGALFAELDAARAAGRSYRLHVVRPRHPLPLDSELFAGRISTDTLIATGYRDGWDYLEQMRPEGVPQDATCTAMTEPPVGVRISERLRGTVADADLTLQVTANLPLEESPEPARVVGHVDYAAWGGRVPLAGGRLAAEGSALVYRARARVSGAWVDVEAVRELADDEGLDAWADATTVEFSASSGERGTLRLGPLDAARALSSAEPVGAHGGLDRAGALARLSRTGLRRVLTTYGS